MLLNWLAGLRNHLLLLRQRSKITGHRRPRSPRVAQIEVLEARRVMSSVSAVSDNYQTQQDQMMMAPPVVMDVLANDDSTGGALSISSVQPPSHGSVTIQQSSGAMGYSAPDQLLYTPAFGFSGIDTFTYTASDAAGDQSTALITVTILPPAGSAEGGANGYGNGYGSNPTPPQVTGLMNNSGSTTGGTSVFISGAGFSQATQVLFGNMLATSFTVNSDSSISAIAPAHAAGNVDVIVVNTTGASSITMNDQFCYQAPIGLPVVSHVSPGTETMSGGDTITVSGNGFMNATAVSFGGTVVSSFMVMSDTSILVTAPLHMAGQVDVQVTTPAGTSMTSADDKLVYSSPVLLPVVTGLTTSTGSTAGGTSVTILGANLADVTAVWFGSQQATFVVNSPTSITAITPTAMSGSVDVTVTNSVGTSGTSQYDQFTFQSSSPTVTGLSVTTGSASGGTSVTISGSNFQAVTGVFFGSVAASSFMVSGTGAIYAVAPMQAPGAVDVTVVTASGTSVTTTADQFTYQAPIVPPTITSVSPGSETVSGGDTITIWGTGFTNVAGVTFGGTAALGFTVLSPTMMTALAPAHASGVVDIQVTTSAGASLANNSDQLRYAPEDPPAPSSVLPVVSSLSNSVGSTAGGATVVITGQNFTGVTAVWFGTQHAASFVVNSATSITAVTSPQLPGAVDVTVANDAGTSAVISSDRFTFQSAVPIVTAVSPGTASVAGGDWVTISGTGFANVTAVRFGDAAAENFTVVSPNSIRAIAPPSSAGTLDVQVTTSAGVSAPGSSDQIQFESGSSTPVIASLSATTGSASGGTAVTILGSGFDQILAVNFGSVAATSFSVSNGGVIVAIAPPQDAGTVDITVIGVDGTSPAATSDQFTYTVPDTLPEVASVSPIDSSGLVTITGADFVGVTGVTFGGVSATYAVQSPTSIVAFFPTGLSGAVDVAVTTGAGVSQNTASDRVTAAGSTTESSPAAGSYVLPSNLITQFAGALRDEDLPGYISVSDVGASWSFPTGYGTPLYTFTMGVNSYTSQMGEHDVTSSDYTSRYTAPEGWLITTEIISSTTTDITTTSTSTYNPDNGTSTMTWQEYATIHRRYEVVMTVVAANGSGGTTDSVTTEDVTLRSFSQDGSVSFTEDDHLVRTVLDDLVGLKSAGSTDVGSFHGFARDDVDSSLTQDARGGTIFQNFQFTRTGSDGSGEVWSGVTPTNAHAGYVIDRDQWHSSIIGSNSRDAEGRFSVSSLSDDSASGNDSYGDLGTSHLTTTTTSGDASTTVDEMAMETDVGTDQYSDSYQELYSGYSDGSTVITRRRRDSVSGTEQDNSRDFGSVTETETLADGSVVTGTDIFSDSNQETTPYSVGDFEQETLVGVNGVYTEATAGARAAGATPGGKDVAFDVESDVDTFETSDQETIRVTSTSSFGGLTATPDAVPATTIATLTESLGDQGVISFTGMIQGQEKLGAAGQDLEDDYSFGDILSESDQGTDSLTIIVTTHGLTRKPAGDAAGGGGHPHHLRGGGRGALAEGGLRAALLH